MSASPDPATAVTSPSWPIRPIDESEFDDFHAVFYEAFLSPQSVMASRERIRPLVEFDRTLAAFDGDRMVATAGAHSFTMTLPGGACPVAGVMGVSVLPTHRRRGLLTALMRRQLTDIHARGEAVAALFASEGGIYGRFGYGPAAYAADVTIRRGEGRQHSGVPRDPTLRLRLASPIEVRTELAAVHRDVVEHRAGEIARDEARWTEILADSESERDSRSPLTCVLVEDGSGVVGYALYRTALAWDAYSVPTGEIRVSEVYATTAPAHAALWDYLLDIDLTATVSAVSRPLDDPLYHLLADPFRARTVVSPNIWLRLVDVAAAPISPQRTW